MYRLLRLGLWILHWCWILYICKFSKTDIVRLTCCQNYKKFKKKNILSNFRPYVAVLGNIKGTEIYKDISLYKDVRKDK